MRGLTLPEIRFVPTRVLWLIKGLGLGGAEQLLARSARYVDRSRYEYRAAFLLPWKTALVDDLEAMGIPVTCLHHRIPGDPRVVYHLARLLRRNRIDILHAHLPYTGIIGRCAARLAGTPHVIYTEHNLQERYRPLTRFLNQATLNLCDLTVAVSEEVRRSLLASSIARRKTVRTILNGIDADLMCEQAKAGGDVRQEFNIPPDRPIVGVVNVFRTQKRLDIWIRAAGKIAQAEPNAVFMIVGDGPLRAEIEAKAAREGLGGRVYFPGLRSDAPRLIAAFDIFMMASEFEGLPIAVLEAMALRVPVVATSVGGLPDVLNDGRCGLLVEPGNPYVLAERVVTLLRTPSLRRSLAEAAALRVRERFSIARMVRETEDVYREVLEGSISVSEPARDAVAPEETGVSG